MLTQRPLACYDPSVPTTGTLRMETGHMEDGDVAGLAVFQDPYAYIAVKQENSQQQLVMVNNGETIATAPMGSGTTVYLRAIASNHTEKAVFEYSLDNQTFRQLGNELTMKFNLKVFTGNKFGIFNYATIKPGGYVDVDWFRTNVE